VCAFALLLWGLSFPLTTEFRSASSRIVVAEGGLIIRHVAFRQQTAFEVRADDSWHGLLVTIWPSASRSAFTLPLWLVFVPLIIPTALLWWGYRRFPAGHCQNCGYNLTGNVSGVCTECGTPIECEGETR
jgi:hypothetical protein